MENEGDSRNRYIKKNQGNFVSSFIVRQSSEENDKERQYVSVYVLISLNPRDFIADMLQCKEKYFSFAA